MKSYVNMGLMMTGLLHIAGADAAKFLQGQITCDVFHLAPDVAHLAAHLNPQGRIISLFNIFSYHHDFYLLMPESMVALTLRTLKKYAVFFKITLAPVVASTVSIPPLSCPAFPMIYPETSGQFLPHDLSLHETKAISFQKGCYTGQEIVARMHYRGALKKTLYHGLLEAPLSLMPGTPLSLAQSEEASSAILVEAIPQANYTSLFFVAEIKEAATARYSVRQHNRTTLITHEAYHGITHHASTA